DPKCNFIMKTCNKKFLFHLAIVGIMFFLQSCGGVYNSTNLPMERALESDKPLKIKTSEGKVYKVYRLEQDVTGIHGIARKESNTARKHKEDIIDYDYQEKYVKIDLPEESIQEIRTKNKE